MGLKSKILNWLAARGYRITKLPPPPSSAELNFSVTYLDVGSSGGLPPKWQPYSVNPFFKVVLVEPDEKEANVLKEKYPFAKVVPHALGRSNERLELNITRFPSCSSLLDPDMNVLDRFPVRKGFSVEKRIEVETFSFASLAVELNLSAPDFIKIDVQGYESEVLKGMEHHLTDVLCIELEAHLIPIYKKQFTIEVLNSFLNEKGFFLRHLSPTGIFEEEVVEFDAFYIKMPHLITSQIQRNKIDFWKRVNQLPPGNYYKDWENILTAKS